MIRSELATRRPNVFVTGCQMLACSRRISIVVAAGKEPGMILLCHFVFGSRSVVVGVFACSSASTSAEEAAGTVLGLSVSGRTRSHRILPSGRTDVDKIPRSSHRPCVSTRTCEDASELGPSGDRTSAGNRRDAVNGNRIHRFWDPSLFITLFLQNVSANLGPRSVGTDHEIQDLFIIVIAILEYRSDFTPQVRDSAAHATSSPI